MNKTSNINTLTLLELQTQIKDGLQTLFSGVYSVVAEINEIKTNASGHCYLELVQHDDDSSVPCAKAAATIWAYTYRMLKPYFESETGRSLQAGMKILANVKVQYHEIYGLSLNVLDIDPTYTIGEIELQRQRTIKKLIDDGVFDMNKSLQLPTLPLRIAVISSATAAGYQDFIEQLYNSGRNYKFRTTLFSAVMQGKDADAKIIAAIDKMNKRIDDFDVLVVIRGGGSTSDLSCFDSYNLAYNIAQVPIPVITGIGHDKDISVVDMVANTMLKTPTAVAEFLIECIEHQDIFIDELAERLTDSVREQLQNHTYVLQNIALQLQSLSKIKMTNNKIYVDNFFDNRLKPLLHSKLKECKTLLQMFQKDLESHNPQRILQRGYSVVMFDSKVVNSAEMLKKNDEVDIIFNKGQKKSIIK